MVGQVFDIAIKQLNINQLMHSMNPDGKFAVSDIFSYVLRYFQKKPYWECGEMKEDDPGFFFHRAAR